MNNSPFHYMVGKVYKNSSGDYYFIKDLLIGELDNIVRAVLIRLGDQNQTVRYLPAASIINYPATWSEA